MHGCLHGVPCVLSHLGSLLVGEKRLFALNVQGRLKLGDQGVLKKRLPGRARDSDMDVSKPERQCVRQFFVIAKALTERFFGFPNIQSLPSGEPP